LPSSRLEESLNVFSAKLDFFPHGKKEIKMLLYKILKKKTYIDHGFLSLYILHVITKNKAWRKEMLRQLIKRILMQEGICVCYMMIKERVMMATN